MGKSTCTEEKKRVRERVRKQLGCTETPNRRRPDWLVSVDRSTSVFITCSRVEDLWYDLSATDIEQWLGEYQRAFVLFVMGANTDVLVVPLDIIAVQLVETATKASDGSYKLHIERLDSSIRFKEAQISDVELLPYRNKFELLASN